MSTTMLRQRLNRWGLPWPTTTNKRESSESSHREESDNDDDDSSFADHSRVTTPMLVSKAEMKAMMPFMNHNNTSGTMVVYDDDSMMTTTSRSSSMDENHHSCVETTPTQQSRLLAIDDDDHDEGEEDTETIFTANHQTTTTTAPSSTKSSSNQQRETSRFDDADQQRYRQPTNVTSPLSTVNSNTPKHMMNQQQHSFSKSSSETNQSMPFSSFFGNHHPTDEARENRDPPLLSSSDPNILLPTASSSSDNYENDYFKQPAFILQDLMALSERQGDFITDTGTNPTDDDGDCGNDFPSMVSQKEALNWQPITHHAEKPPEDDDIFGDIIASHGDDYFRMESQTRVVDESQDRDDSQNQKTKPTITMMDIENSISRDSIGGLLSTRSDTSQCSFNSVSSSRWVVENRRNQRLAKTTNQNNPEEKKKVPAGKPPFSFEWAYWVWMSRGMLPENFRPNAKFQPIKKMDRELEQKLKHRRKTIETSKDSTTNDIITSSSVQPQQQTQPLPTSQPSSNNRQVVPNKNEGKNFENILNRWKEVSADKPCSHFLAFQQTTAGDATSNVNQHSKNIRKPSATVANRGTTTPSRRASHNPKSQQEETMNHPSMVAKLQSRAAENEMTRRLSLPNRTFVIPAGSNNSQRSHEKDDHSTTTKNPKITAKSHFSITEPIERTKDAAPVVVEHSTTTARTPHATLRVIGVSAAKAPPPSPPKVHKVEPIIDLSSSTRNLKLQAANMFGRRREKKDGGDEEDPDGSGIESNHRPDYKSVVNAYLRDVDSKTNKKIDHNQSRSKSAPRSTMSTRDNLLQEPSQELSSDICSSMKLPNKNCYKRSQSVPRSHQQLDDFSLLAIRKQIRKEAECIQDVLYSNETKSDTPKNIADTTKSDSFSGPSSLLPTTGYWDQEKSDATYDTDDPLASLNTAIRNQLGREVPSSLQGIGHDPHVHVSTPSEKVLRTQLRKEMVALQQELCGTVNAVTSSTSCSLSSNNFASRKSLKEPDGHPASYVKDLLLENYHSAQAEEKTVIATPKNDATQDREDLFSPFTKQVMEKLEKVNREEDLISPPTNKTIFSQRPWQHDRLIQRVDSMTDESNSILRNEPIGCRECNCSASVFSGNDDMVNFFLPLMGAACTCTNTPFGLINPEEPTSLVNILRPWQVDFLAGFGIYRGEELVKANHRSASALANALRQYRKRENLPPFPTQSCAMALQIWSKTSKAFVRSIRNQLKAAQQGSTESPPRSAKSTELKVPNTLYIISAFLDKMPKETNAIRTVSSNDSKLAGQYQLDTVSTDFSDF